MKNRARDLFRDRRGVSAVEFAVIAPVMAALLIGLGDFSGGLYASRKVASLAQTVADLAARPLNCGGDESRVCISDSDMTDLFNAGKALVSPFNATNLKVTISEVGIFEERANNQGANNEEANNEGANRFSARVIWSATDGGALRSCGALTANDARPVSPGTIPRGFVETRNNVPPKAGSIIVVDAIFPYSALGGSGPSIMLEATGYASVRNMRSAAVSENLPIGHIRNESGQGTNCVAD